MGTRAAPRPGYLSPSMRLGLDCGPQSTTLMVQPDSGTQLMDNRLGSLPDGEFSAAAEQLKILGAEGEDIP